MTMADAPTGPFYGTPGAQNAPDPTLISHVGRHTTAAPIKFTPMVDYSPRGGQIDHVGVNFSDDSIVRLHDEPESLAHPSDPVDTTTGVRYDGTQSRLPIF